MQAFQGSVPAEGESWACRSRSAWPALLLRSALTPEGGGGSTLAAFAERWVEGHRRKAWVAHGEPRVDHADGLLPVRAEGADDAVLFEDSCSFFVARSLESALEEIADGSVAESAICRDGNI